MSQLMTTPVPMTVEEYMKLPEQTNKCELINGELIMSPAPNWYHQDISKNIEYALEHFLRGNPLGKMFHAPFDVTFSPVTVLQPDIVFISAGNLSLLDHHGAVGAPDLVIEILSQGSSRRDLGEKRQLFQANLVKEIWYISPKKKTVEVERLGSSGYEPPVLYTTLTDTVTSPLLPGFSITLEAIFQSEFSIPEPPIPGTT